MANPIGNRLSRLVRERAYLSGSLSGLEEEVRLTETTLVAKRRRLELTLQRLAEINQKITEISAIDLSKIAAIRRTPRVGKKEHGALGRTVIELMKSGQPMSTVELIRFMAQPFGWDLSTIKGRKYAMDAVRQPLRRFKAMGVVERLSDGLAETGQLCGVWRWIGPPDADNPPAQ